MISVHVLPALILGWLLVLPSALVASPSELHDRVVTVLQQEGLTGAVWSTVDTDGSVAVDAAGVKDARSGALLEAEDRVHVGSVTKTLLATGVLRLVSQQRIALETPVSEVLPGIVFDNPWAATDPVRIRHLLDFSAGLDDARFWQVFSQRPRADTPLAAAFPAGRNLLRVRSRPGSRCSYSNMGFTLLGMVIESLTGQRYERYLDTHLLAPLGMHDSTFGFVSQQGPLADPRLAMGHFENAAPHPAAAVYLRPPMQFTTTAKDMARFAGFLMGDGRIDGAAFIDPPLLRAMGQPRATEAARAGLRVGYGLGLFTRDRHGVVGRCHGGSTVGYSAMFCLFPEQQRAFFVAINTDSEEADYGRIDALLIEAMGVQTARPALSSIAAVDAGDWQGFYVPTPNRFASFEWLDTTFDFLHASTHGNGLQLRSLQSADSLLIPVGGSLFKAADRTIASHALLLSSEGKRVISTGTRSYQRVSPWRLVLLWISLIAGALGILYVAIKGSIRALTRRLHRAHPLLVPWLGVLALAVPLPWLLTQSFMRLGDVTVGNVLLAIATAVLPLAMCVGLVSHFRQGRGGLVAALDAWAMTAALQWLLVLAIWGLLPLRLWVI